MKARYNEALAEVQGLFDLYNFARVQLEPVAQAEERLLHAGLALCEKPADKVALLTQYVELTKRAEQITQARLEAVRMTSAPPLHRARYQRLDAEIQLLRAKREADGAKKNSLTLGKEKRWGPQIGNHNYCCCRHRAGSDDGKVLSCDGVA